MKLFTLLWETSSADLQTCFSDQEQQYGCHDNDLQQELLSLRFSYFKINLVTSNHDT